MHASCVRASLCPPSLPGQLPLLVHPARQLCRPILAVRWEAGHQASGLPVASFLPWALILLIKFSAAWRCVHWPIMALVSIAADRACAINSSLIQVSLRHIVPIHPRVNDLLRHNLLGGKISFNVPFNAHVGFDLSNMHMMAPLCQLLDAFHYVHQDWFMCTEPCCSSLFDELLY